MNELINNSASRKSLLKHIILQIHQGEEAPEQLKQRLSVLMQKIPYGEIVEVEQELINEGLPESEVKKLCNVHAKVLEGSIDHSNARKAPAGHPVDTFIKENAALLDVISELDKLFADSEGMISEKDISTYFGDIHARFNLLMDVDKHYRKKENLLFPFLERYGITGPPKVMWGKHDDARELLKAALESLRNPEGLSLEETRMAVEMIFKPACAEIKEMIMKEDEILFPMCMDKLTDTDWYEIYQQSPEIGFCLIDPEESWKPEGIELKSQLHADTDKINLPSGSLNRIELLAILNSLPVDITFVDKNDKVKYFSQGKHRIFDRNRAILNRDVTLCHPPSSVRIVEKILDDFSSGREDSAPFWIQMGDRFIHIEYFALRDEQGKYLGTLEVSQDLTEKRKLQGEQRILSYGRK